MTDPRDRVVSAALEWAADVKEAGFLAQTAMAGRPKAVALFHAVAALPADASERHEEFAFGYGALVVDTGLYDKRPAVFIIPAKQPHRRPVKMCR